MKTTLTVAFKTKIYSMDAVANTLDNLGLVQNRFKSRN